MELKCKVCGGRLAFQDDSFSSTCEYCGVSQFIFDYLDKNSDDYDKQVEIIRSAKEEVENLYNEYTDDVVNADSYCWSSKDLLKIIQFFDKCGEYREAPVLLSRAKRLFLSKISSTADCAIALQYLEEIDDLTSEEKGRYNQKISELTISFTIKELEEKGFLVVIPKESSPEILLATARNLLNAASKNRDTLTAIENDIVCSSLDTCVQYLKANMLPVINSAQNKDVLCAIRKHIPALKQAFIQLQAWNVESALEDKIAELVERDRIAEEENAFRIKQENKKKRIKKTCILAIVICIVLGLIAFSLYQDREFSPDNISINVLSKTNDTFNEELSSKHSESGYFYSFDFEVTNNGSEGVKLIRGDLEIISERGKVLSTSSLVMRIRLDGKSSEREVVQLNVKTGPSARELWNTDLEDLEIRFKIREIHLIDGPSNTYSDTKNVVIHEIEP